MMKKLSAIALAATMMLSLIGCSKKNFDGNYTAELDLTDSVVESIEAGFGETDYEWTGTYIESYKLELSEGKYNYSTDIEASKESYLAFLRENVEAYLYSVAEAELAADPDLAGMTVDEVLEASGYSIWECYTDYKTEDEYIDEVANTFDSYTEEESGEYEIDGDSITLKGVDTIDEDGNEGEGWVLTYEDGNLTGIQYMDEDNLDEETEITFVRDAE